MYSVNTSISSLYQHTNFILPTIFQAANYLTYQDERIARIYAGIVLTLTGLQILVASGLPNQFKSWCREENAGLEETTALTALRWSTATAGSALTWLGLLFIASGILDIIKSYGSQVVLHKPFDESFTQGDTSDCQVRLEEAKKELLSCPAVKTFWNKVAKEGAFSIECASPRQVPFGAKVLIDERRILISSNRTEMVTPLLFELINLSKSEGILLIYENRCRLGMDYFAETFEAIEFYSSKQAYLLSSQCQKEGHWNVKEIPYEFLFSFKGVKERDKFQIYYKIQNDHNHTDLYRRDWAKKCLPSKQEL